MKDITGVICAVDAELKPYLENLAGVEISGKAMLTFYRGQICGKAITAVSSGVGRVNAAVAAQILIDNFSVKRIIVSGAAGGIDSSLRIGDTVVSEDAAYHDIAENMLAWGRPGMTSAFMRADREMLDRFKKAVKNTDFRQKIVFGRIVTGETFIEKSGREEIISRFKPLCVDMETAGVAHVCYLNGIPFIAVKSVTDTEAECGLQAFKDNCAAAAENSYAVAESYLRYKSYLRYN